MLFFSSRLNRPIRDNESGIALAEVMASAIIIVLVLTANAYALLSAYNAYGTAENANKAYQIINKQFAYFKQASFDSLGTVTQSNSLPKTAAGGAACDPLTTPFPATGENVAIINKTKAYKYTSDSNEVPFQFCQAVQYPAQAKPVTLYDVTGARKLASDGTTSPGGLGITYYYQTVITNVGTGTFDSNTLPQNSDSTTFYNPKRITVTVRWVENDSQSGSDTRKTQQVRLSTVRTPLISDCVPGGVKDANGATIGLNGCGF